MAENPIQTPLPADLPTDWDIGQTVAPDGQTAGLTRQHGYNYLMEQVNKAQEGVNALGTAFPGLATLGEDGKIPAQQLPPMDFYTKEETLSDEVAEALGGVTTPSEAFKKLHVMIGNGLTDAELLAFSGSVSNRVVETIITSKSWKAPSNMLGSTILVIALGGSGGNGGRGGNGGTYTFGGDGGNGGRGGSGNITIGCFKIEKSKNYDCVIGGAGSNGSNGSDNSTGLATTGTNGSNGGSTEFGGIVFASGGLGGYGGTGGSYSGYGGTGGRGGNGGYGGDGGDGGYGRRGNNGTASGGKGGQGGNGNIYGSGGNGGGGGRAYGGTESNGGGGGNGGNGGTYGKGGSGGNGGAGTTSTGSAGNAGNDGSKANTPFTGPILFAPAVSPDLSDYSESEYGGFSLIEKLLGPPNFGQNGKLILIYPVKFSD